MKATIGPGLNFMFSFCKQCVIPEIIECCQTLLCLQEPADHIDSHSMESLLGHVFQERKRLLASFQVLARELLHNKVCPCFFGLGSVLNGQMKR